MKVINISLDKKILDKDSAVARRAVAYGDLLEEYFIVVPGENKNIELSAKTKLCGIEASNKFLILLKIYQYLKDYLKNNKYDLITIQDVYYLASIGVNLANKFGIKSELQVHGFEKLSFFRKTIAKDNLRKADKIRVVSQRLKGYLVKEFSVAEEKIYIVPIAIDKDSLLAKSGETDLKQQYNNSFIFLTVTRLVKVKNIAMQIRALASLADQDAQLVIVGDGPDKANLEKLVDSLGIRARVHFVGWVDELADYYHSADCLLLSSDSEGYGAVVAESVLVGLPVIMTDVGVAGELVENNVNGLIVAVGDQEAFAKAMTRVIEEESLLQEFSTNTFTFSDKILDREQLINKVFDNWKDIV